jgi:hypothetical protein
MLRRTRHRRGRHAHAVGAADLIGAARWVASRPANACFASVAGRARRRTLETRCQRGDHRRLRGDGGLWNDDRRARESIAEPLHFEFAVVTIVAAVWFDDLCHLDEVGSALRGRLSQQRGRTIARATNARKAAALAVSHLDLAEGRRPGRRIVVCHTHLLRFGAGRWNGGYAVARTERKKTCGRE